MDGVNEGGWGLIRVKGGGLEGKGRLSERGCGSRGSDRFDP